MWSIRVLSGAQAGQMYDLKLGKNVFGRGGASDFKVQSLGISKEHCEIHVYKDKMMIVDLKSSNGTFVNGVKIQNSIIRVGDKVSLFDIIMDVIPAPDIRPKVRSEVEKSADEEVKKTKQRSKQKRAMRPPVPVARNSEIQSYQNQINYPQHGNGAVQMYGDPSPQMFQNSYSQQNVQMEASAANPTPVQLTFQEKIDNYMENKVMPAIYKLAVIFSFKAILQSFILIFIFSVTMLSVVPLTNIIKESNLKEAQKRARSIARALAKQNESALLSGQLANLSVIEALKEEGIKDAFIIQQSDGMIVAPPEKAGRDEASSLVLTARKESRSTYAMVDSNTIGATFPIIVYDPSSGEAIPKYHTIVKYDISSLNFDEGKIVSLFMQTLIISSVLGLILYQLFARLIEFPIKNLNAQIDKAMLEKSDRTEIAFDYPVFQKLVSNVNTILNRAWSGESSSAGLKPQQNKDVEYSNLVQIISHPAILVDSSQKIIAINSSFEHLLQVSADSVVNQSYQNLNDSALVQNMESLIARSQQSPFEKQTDRIPFSQFECEIFCQVFLDSNGDAQYYILTLVQIA